MKSKKSIQRISGVGLLFLLLWTSQVSAQTFSSGSTGADGPFNPTSNTTVSLPPDGVLNYTTVNIPSGVTVTFSKNAANTPVTMLATGDVTIAGTLSVNGSNGFAPNSTLDLVPGAKGGPGGFDGGQSGSRGLTNNPGSAGQGPGGAQSSSGTNVFNGTYGAPASFETLIPLFGGSGGGGGAGTETLTGGSGGGGGGAIVIASTTKITITGSITANGGVGGKQQFTCNLAGGAGSGGAIRLVALEFTSSGTIQAVKPNFCTSSQSDGRIRIETLVPGPVAPTTPPPSISTTLGPITPASTPALINLPTLTISFVGGEASPATPLGRYNTADVSLPAGTTNPVTVTLTANYIPVGTVFSVKLIPQFDDATVVNSTASAGTLSSSTATADVTFPEGRISVLNAFASFTLPQMASNPFPVIVEGEKVEKIKVAAVYGGDSSIYLITESGREVPYQLGMQ